MLPLPTDVIYHNKGSVYYLYQLLSCLAIKAVYTTFTNWCYFLPNSIVYTLVNLQPSPTVVIYCFKGSVCYLYQLVLFIALLPWYTTLTNWCYILPKRLCILLYQQVLFNAIRPVYTTFVNCHYLLACKTMYTSLYQLVLFIAIKAVYAVFTKCRYLLP